MFIAGTQLNHSLMLAYCSYYQQVVVVIGKMTHHWPAKEEIDFLHYVTGLEMIGNHHSGWDRRCLVHK